MPSNPIKSRWAGPLALVLLLTSMPPATHAGVLSQMFARRRAERQLRAQTTSSTIKGQTMIGESGSMSLADHGDHLRAQYGLSMPGEPGAMSTAGRLKKRFSPRGKLQGMAHKIATSRPFSSDRDPGVMKTSR